jgi:DNA-binding NarL/FixJ family response regulator
MTARLLIVEDEPEMAKLIGAILSPQGYRCTLTGGAREARSALARQSFELVLSDINMPDGSGIDLAREIARDYPDTAVILVSAINDMTAAAIESGISGYVLKPFDLHQLRISVANALRRRELELKSRAHEAHLEQTVAERTAELKRLNATLREREAQLRQRVEEFEELNIALNALLKKRERDKAEMEEKIVLNIRQSVMPYLEKIRKGRLDEDQRACLKGLEDQLRELTAPLLSNLRSVSQSLTPAELEVAQMIKQGRRTKEIAELLHLSRNTVMTHRFNIRNKLKLLHSKTNLRSFLQSLDS